MVVEACYDGRRNHARRKPQSSTSTVAYALSIRNLPLSVAVAAARDGRPGASQGGAATTAARLPSPSLSLFGGFHRGVGAEGLRTPLPLRGFSQKGKGLRPLMPLFFLFFLALKAQSTKTVSPISNLLFETIAHRSFVPKYI